MAQRWEHLGLGFSQSLASIPVLHFKNTHKRKYYPTLVPVTQIIQYFSCGTVYH